jgi:hypothetical protein
MATSFHCKRKKKKEKRKKKKKKGKKKRGEPATHCAWRAPPRGERRGPGEHITRSVACARGVSTVSAPTRRRSTTEAMVEMIRKRCHEKQKVFFF